MKQLKQLRNLLLSIIIGSILIIPAASLQAAPPEATPPGTTAYVKDRILLRVEPKPTARAIATLEANAQVQVNHCKGGWCSVTKQGVTGYVLEEFLFRKTPLPPAKR